MRLKKPKYIIGVDGGGTKTEAALANLDGKILKIGVAGPSNPRNEGIQKSVSNILKAINKIRRGKKIASIFIGLPAIEEEFKFRKRKLKNEIFKKLKNFRGKLKIGSDQIVAFKSGTDEKNGIVLISGTGCVVHGWKGKKEAKASGWGWLADEGSGFWVAQKGFQAILKELDGRGPKTKITKLILKEWKLKNREDFLRKIYLKKSISFISSISKVVDKAAKKGDKVAISIMEMAAKELVQSAISVINKLDFHKQKFPFVLVGKMFESEIVLSEIKKEIKKIAPNVKFLRPKTKPVIGAVKLAIGLCAAGGS